MPEPPFAEFRILPLKKYVFDSLVSFRASGLVGKSSTRRRGPDRSPIVSQKVGLLPKAVSSVRSAMYDIELTFRSSTELRFPVE